MCTRKVFKTESSTFIHLGRCPVDFGVTCQLDHPTGRIKWNGQSHPIVHNEVAIRHVHIVAGKIWDHYTPSIVTNFQKSRTTTTVGCVIAKPNIVFVVTFALVWTVTSSNENRLCLSKMLHLFIVQMVRTTMFLSTIFMLLCEYCRFRDFRSSSSSGVDRPPISWFDVLWTISKAHIDMEFDFVLIRRLLLLLLLLLVVVVVVFVEIHHDTSIDAVASTCREFDPKQTKVRPMIKRMF
mmetsp:Transcript_15270/g.37698  ORF Transcript_15270/g.37698 Transcript_15270/m.37698 type:complete len:238 (-) Transcript_15270:861-1574(-)